MKRVAVASALLLIVLALPARADATSFVWHLDEAPGSTTVTSVNGYVGTLHHHGGTGAVLISPSTYDASAAMLTFDGHGRVIVPDDDALDPRKRPFSVTVHVRTTAVPNATVGDFDLMRKGLATDRRYWKVELYPNKDHTQAFAFCQMRGYIAATSSFASVRLKYKGANLADGAWHEITCTKTNTQVTLAVDGKVRVRNDKAIGGIKNPTALSMGAKAQVWDDQYIGDMDEVSYTIG